MEESKPLPFEDRLGQGELIGPCTQPRRPKAAPICIVTVLVAASVSWWLWSAIWGTGNFLFHPPTHPIVLCLKFFKGSFDYFQLVRKESFRIEIQICEKIVFVNTQTSSEHAILEMTLLQV